MQDGNYDSDDDPAPPVPTLSRVTPTINPSTNQSRTNIFTDRPSAISFLLSQPSNTSRDNPNTRKTYPTKKGKKGGMYKKSKHKKSRRNKSRRKKYKLKTRVIFSN